MLNFLPHVQGHIAPQGFAGGGAAEDEGQHSLLQSIREAEGLAQFGGHERVHPAEEGPSRQ